MPKLLVIDRSGKKSSIDGVAGLSIMSILRDRGFDDILALCGGSCSCATCHVYVHPEFIERLPPAGDDERMLLDASDQRAPGSRLSCQIPFSEALDGIEVIIAPAD